MEKGVGGEAGGRRRGRRQPPPREALIPVAPPVSGGWRPAPRLHSALDQGPYLERAPDVDPHPPHISPEAGEKPGEDAVAAEAPVGPGRGSGLPSGRQGTQHQPGTGHGRPDEGP